MVEHQQKTVHAVYRAPHRGRQVSEPQSLAPTPVIAKALVAALDDLLQEADQAGGLSDDVRVIRGTSRHSHPFLPSTGDERSRIGVSNPLRNAFAETDKIQLAPGRKNAVLDQSCCVYRRIGSKSSGLIVYCVGAQTSVCRVRNAAVLIMLLCSRVIWHRRCGR
ncbi:hypothetical protein LO772_30360 [Yinghuangia sp. ASG 101]|uniref:hypothetical protein n=1 Tax=Yinghuangia sp. ASG 101 TaxID=2896848 RepID=UPI001E2A083B|nr:hypothetical protein [Yinghuangia sp. ASG 101]UGQ11065.1 hypothetical protein LO772_30360 [Yinghuangia sp. ASG 101]